MLAEQIVQFLQQLFVLVNDLTAVPYAVAFITLVVSLFKRVPFFADIPAQYIHLVAQVAFWVVYATLNHFGHGEQLQQWTEAAAIVLQTLLPLVVSLFGGSWAYSKAVDANIPLWGYQRS